MPEKLIRDRVLDKIKAKGEVVTTRVAADSEMMGFLAAKLHEEAGELLAAGTREEKLDELGDVVEVVIALFDELGLNFYFDVYSLGEKKVEELGGFKKKIILIQDDAVAPEEKERR